MATFILGKTRRLGGYPIFRQTLLIRSRNLCEWVVEPKWCGVISVKEVVWSARTIRLTYPYSHVLVAQMELDHLNFCAPVYQMTDLWSTLLITSLSNYLLYPSICRLYVCIYIYGNMGASWSIYSPHESLLAVQSSLSLLPKNPATIWGNQGHQSTNSLPGSQIIRGPKLKRFLWQ